MWCAAWRLAANSPTSRKGRDCYCKPTVREIGCGDGKEHLRLVLMLVTGNKRNADHIQSAVREIVPSIQNCRDGAPDL